MGQPPIWGDPLDPYEKYRVEALERDRLAKEEKQKKAPEEPKKEIALGAQLLLLFNKLVELFEEATERGLTPKAEKKIGENLFSLKDSLEKMKREDFSQDSIFLGQVSQQWHQLLDDALKFKRSTPLAIRFIALIKSIESYPENSEHTLGYYLMEHAGKRWLPFPFMELVQKMHKDHQKDPYSSILTLWTAKIDELLRALTEAKA